MPCETLRIGDTTALLCRGRRTRCSEAGCNRVSEFQCDFPTVYKSGKKAGQKRTCDRHLCSHHAKHGVTKGIDFCREHFPIALDAYKRRTKPKMATDFCEKCKRAVYWLRSNKTGKPGIIDVVPSENGNIVADFHNETYDVLSGKALEEARSSGAELRVSHFVTCPQVEYFRRPKRKEAAA